MRVIVKVLFISRGLRVVRSGSFPLKGRTPVKVAFDWIQEIKKEMEIDGLISVIVNEKEDITDKVMDLKW